MKKLVLVAALFMLVCGGSFLANAQDPVKKEKPVTEQSKDSTTTEPVKEDSTVEEPKSAEPKSDQPATEDSENDAPATSTSTQSAE